MTSRATWLTLSLVSFIKRCCCRGCICLFYSDVKLDLCMHINTLNAVTHITEGWYRHQITSWFTVPESRLLFQMRVNERGQHDAISLLERLVLLSLLSNSASFWNFDIKANRAMYCLDILQLHWLFSICMSPNKPHSTANILYIFLLIFKF